METGGNKLGTAKRLGIGRQALEPEGLTEIAWPKIRPGFLESSAENAGSGLHVKSLKRPSKPI
jgi:hypothetical protein